jgi:hypothetical protein
MMQPVIRLRKTKPSSPRVMPYVPRYTMGKASKKE